MNQSLTFEKFSSFYQPEILFEVSYTRSPILKQIDELFYELKQDPDNKTIWRQIEKRIEEFTNIPKVIFGSDEETFNAFVVPFYKDNLPDLFSKIEKNKSRIHAEESPKYIKYIIVFFGGKLIENFTNREITSILLHELGHVYQHTANYSMLLLKRSTRYGREFFGATGLAMGVASLYNPALLPLLITSFILTRSLTYFEHARELDADEYAAKYGYGEELVNCHNKYHRLEQGDDRSWLRKIWDTIKYILLAGTHPHGKDRICNLIKKMKEDHKKLYPKFTKKVNIIYADLKC